MRSSKYPESGVAYISILNIKLRKHFVKQAQQIDIQLSENAFKSFFTKGNQGNYICHFPKRRLGRFSWEFPVFKTSISFLKNLLLLILP